ncbi:small-conductance mechanosensitive channel MscS [Rahnella inusitata]|uniref:small-conductance mechanosensitive channel MscS n=1 Tax=Rahnella inusitata TaxID=58169 RepID=UPI001BC840E7|nr:small-conductance mechanosensitive channel MscS [Rahnella inusitata]QUT17300.1 small-conductance mechanosensitive channel MscS [Rahnella inusitata]
MQIKAFPLVREFNSWVANNQGAIAQGLINLIGAIFIILLGIFISRVLSSGLKRLLTNRGVDKTITQFCSTLLRYGLLAFAVIAALGRIGVETSSIIAIIGAAGLAIGLALQSSLANFAAGVLLVSLRPFKAGEYASVGGNAGVIEEVHIFSTTLRTSDNKTVVVPNGKIIAGDIINYSRQKHRRVDITVSVAYKTCVHEIKQLLTLIIERDDRIIHEMGHTVRLNEFGPSSLIYVVRVWTQNATYWDVYFDLMENIKSTFDDHHINMPYPQMDVHIHQPISSGVTS